MRKSRITDKEHAVRHALASAELLYKKARSEIDDARAALGKDCTHPEETQTDYRWEHDNGYGHQQFMSGRLCTLCGAIQHDKDSYWTLAGEMLIK